MSKEHVPTPWLALVVVGLGLLMMLVGISVSTWLSWVKHPDWTERKIFLEYPLVSLGCVALILGGLGLMGLACRKDKHRE